MPLTCSCGDPEDADWISYHPNDYSEMPAFKHRRRCSSCHELIDTGSIVAAFECYRYPRNEIEEKIRGEGAHIPIATRYLCETCADLYFSLVELGFECIGPEENMRELVREYAETFKTQNNAILE